MGRKQNRCGKKKREERRAVYAETFNDGFTMGYEMGYQQGQYDYKNALKLEYEKATNKGGAKFETR